VIPITNFAMWSLIVGFFAPPVIAIVQQQKWSNAFRAVVTFVLALVAGAGTAYFQGDLTGKRFVEASLIILVAAISTYHGFWKPTEIGPKIEKATSPGGA